MSDWIKKQNKNKTQLYTIKNKNKKSKQDFNYKDTDRLKEKGWKELYHAKRKNKKSEVVNKHMKRCSPSLIIREMQIKVTKKYHFTSIKSATIKNKKQTIASIGEDME